MPGIAQQSCETAADIAGAQDANFHLDTSFRTGDEMIVIANDSIQNTVFDVGS
ncbi:hypothetical protein [Salinisphaera sp. Q1T1-3]|uniref:hypothetical protein n=1 Tax=Salinisphaera sp. Q1T1-3 TaxID=2321229 RepID=UPI0018F57BCC|nr:hypothetical protein [Salinisphaera sp. Q1T1-3]